MAFKKSNQLKSETVSHSHLLCRIPSHKKRLAVFRTVPVNAQGVTLLNLPRRIREKIFEGLDNKEILQILHYLDLDEVSNLLRATNSRRQRTLLAHLHADIKKKVEFLLKFEPESAGALMDLNYIQVEKGIIFAALAKEIREHERLTGKLPAVFVVVGGFLIGEISGHSLAIRKPEEKIDEYIRKVPTVNYNSQVAEVLGTFKRHPHDKVVVLDEDRSILGVIYSDDLLQLLQKQPGRSLYSFAGVSHQEDVSDPFWVKLKFRYKWLIINLGTAFLAASVVGMFQDTLSRIVLLAAYMPIVAGMGGNAATQAMAVMVRGLALREIDFKSGGRIIFNEMITGAFNGLINGIIVSIVATLVNANPILGLVTAVAMVTNLVVAGLFGALVPMIMKRLGKDPASSASIFITTATDVCGFMVFLGLASWLL